MQMFYHFFLINSFHGYRLKFYRLSLYFNMQIVLLLISIIYHITYELGRVAM